MQIKLVQSGADSWTARVELPPGLNGQRRQKRVTFKGTKTQAKAALEKVKADILRGDHTDAGKMTVSMLLDRWLLSRSTRVARSTYERYEGIVNDHVRPVLGHLKLGQLRGHHLERAIEMWKTGPRRDRKKGRLSQRTVHHIYHTARAALRSALRWELIGRDPCDQVDWIARGDRKVVGLDPKLVPALFAGLHDTEVFLPAMLATFCGLRRGEILGLRWPDLDEDARVLKIDYSLDEGRDRSLLLKDVKTYHSHRSVALPEFVYDALYEYRDELKNVFGRKIPEHIFVNWKTGQVRSPDALSSAFYHIIRARDLPRVSFHGLRHTYSNLMKSINVPLVVTSRSMGHSSIAITGDLYTDVIADELSAAAAALDLSFKSIVGNS